jgi:hypothetical protein
MWPGGAGADEFKQKAHHPAAGHADIALQVPLVLPDQAARGQHLLRFGDGLGLHPTPAKCASEQTVGSDHGFPSEHAGNAATHLQDRHHHTGLTLAMLLS